MRPRRIVEHIARTARDAAQAHLRPAFSAARASQSGDSQIPPSAVATLLLIIRDGDRMDCERGNGEGDCHGNSRQPPSIAYTHGDFPRYELLTEARLLTIVNLSNAPLSIRFMVDSEYALTTKVQWDCTGLSRNGSQPAA
jgi:hypothetical protein